MLCNNRTAGSWRLYSFLPYATVIAAMLLGGGTAPAATNGPLAGAPTTTATDPCAEVDCSSLNTSCSTVSCDPSGAEGNCDVVTPEAAGTVCRTLGGICDEAEVCDGASANCPTDAVAPASTVCRAATGVCDVVETCDGDVKTCPADALATSDTVCRIGSGDLCDPDEVCTGGAAACPADAFESTATVCRGSATGDETCDASEVCPGVAQMACPPDLIAEVGTLCGDDTVNSCTATDSCDGQGTCLVNNRACSLVTDSELCDFDVSPKGICVNDLDDLPTGDPCDLETGTPTCPEESHCVSENQFRVLFTPDRQDGVAYKLTATNPGQFFYNLVSTGTPGLSETFNIRVPYPFVTQGAQPVHVYDGDRVGNVSGDDCFMPPEEPLATSDAHILMQDWTAGVATDAARHFLTCDQVCGPDGSGLCTFDVTATYPESGALYINVHLAYGLKGVHVDANPCDDGLVDRYDRDTVASAWESFEAFVDTLDDRLDRTALSDGQSYRMSHEELSAATEFSDTVQNLNDFKGSAARRGEDVGGHHSRRRRGDEDLRGANRSLLLGRGERLSRRERQ